MKRFVVLTALLFAITVRAQVPLGTAVATFPYTPSRLVADPVRPRVYVADPPTSSIVVIDTTTLEVVAAIPIGGDPVDIAIPPSGVALYVAITGSSRKNVRVLDLESLTITAKYAIPGTAMAIAASLDGFLYVSTNIGFGLSSVNKVDAFTGEVLSTFNQTSYDNDLLQITPDGSTLFIANRGGYFTDDDTYPGTLKSFDVIAQTPFQLLDNEAASNNALQLVISHNGEYVCLPAGGGNTATGADTELYSTDYLTPPFGAFANGSNPGPLAFSPDDSLVYQTVSYGGVDGAPNVLQIFDTQSFAKVGELPFPAAPGTDGNPNTITSAVGDNTGSYLFIGESAVQGAVGDPSAVTVGQLVVLATGAGTLAPPAPPVVSLDATAPTAHYGDGETAAFTLTLSAPASMDVKLTYSVKGTGVNGEDYAFLKGSARVKAGKSSKVIAVTPLGAGDAKRTVKLTLLPGAGYTVGTSASAKVKLLPPGE